MFIQFIVYTRSFQNTFAFSFQTHIQQKYTRNTYKTAKEEKGFFLLLAEQKMFSIIFCRAIVLEATEYSKSRYLIVSLDFTTTIMNIHTEQS